MLEEIQRQKDELEKLNAELAKKTQQLEVQNALVEELNAQLAEEVEKYQQQKDMLQAIAFSVEEGIAMINTSGRLVFINKLWKSIFDYRVDRKSYISSKDFLNHIRGVVKREDGCFLYNEDILEDFEGTYTTELEQIIPEHKYLKIYSAPCIAKSKQAIGRIFVCRDISHDNEIDKLKSELISTVSHELRTPMSSIMGFSELILTRELSPERSRKYVEIIYNESHRLTKLINDFLDIQRMESGRQEFSKSDVPLSNLLKKVLSLFQDIGNRHRIVCHGNLEDSVSVCCDADKIIQVISNLLSNAVKYSPQGGDIVINAQKCESMLKISIKDTGLGIPEEVMDKLFTKFFRVDNDDRREIGGTGLGLAICREIVQAHDGSIWAESTYGKGSTFYFTIPLSMNSIEVAPKTVVKKQQSSDSILIVEDDENLAKLIEDVLKDDGFNTYTVRSGEEALKLIDETDFRMILLDIGLMGRLTGWDIVKTLKDNDRTAKIPVVISSVYENKNEPMHEEVRDYLVKPFELPKLLNVIHKVIEEDSKSVEKADENLKNYITDILGSKDIKVRDCQVTGSMLIITLDGENQDEVK